MRGQFSRGECYSLFAWTSPSCRRSGQATGATVVRVGYDWDETLDGYP
jgi:hypothetical protein